MKAIDLSNVKGIYSITRNNDYVILSGKNIFIFRVDGTFVAANKSVGSIRKVLVISENRVLVDCGNHNCYIVLSLKDGSELWRIERPRLDYSSNSFALSPDNEHVYDYCYIKETPMLVTIDLCFRKVHTTIIHSDLRGLSDLVCDNEGAPCLLQHHYDTQSGRHVSVNGILCERRADVPMDEKAFWKHRWTFDFPRISCLFLGNSDMILTQDLCVFDPRTHVIYSLIENDPNWVPPGKRPSSCTIDPSNRFITVSYQNIDVVIDCKQRKVIAQYLVKFWSGCLVNDEYWICSDSGIQRMPFPLMENLPAVKPLFWYPRAQLQDNN